MRNLLSVLLLGSFLLFAESVAGVKWSTPQGWKTGAARPMRAATYSVPMAPGDHDPAECAVYFFGQGSGGGIPANIERWKSQIVQNGQPAQAKVDKRTIHGLTVTMVESAGDYMGMQQQAAAHNYKLLGAIVEGPGGNVFIKFTGPAKTVEANRKAFDALLGSFQKE